jgi:hypothetical protein
VLACRFCGASIDVPISARESLAWDDVFRLQRTLLACAKGQPVEQDWVGRCAPGTFLRMIRDLLTLVANQDADGATVLAEYVPNRGWEYPCVRRRGDRHWVLCSIGERLSLLSAVVALLRGRRPRRQAVRQAEDPFEQLWPAISTPQRDTLRVQARRWPSSIRHRLDEAALLSP